MLNGLNKKLNTNDIYIDIYSFLYNYFNRETFFPRNIYLFSVKSGDEEVGGGVICDCRLKIPVFGVEAPGKFDDDE